MQKSVKEGCYALELVVRYQGRKRVQPPDHLHRQDLPNQRKILRQCLYSSR